MTQKEMEKVYDPKKVEDKWYKRWLEMELFNADNASQKPTYTIMIPPPNVTGMLTMGHILNNAIQDLLIRWKHMQGFETLWMPGTDHAGIATQNKVEAAIAEEGLNRHMLGRDALIERIWQWKEKYGGIILKQLRKLGAACDWERERFTMDEGLSRAVKEVFVRLYEKGFIYQGRRLINWCPRCHTALSDEEAPKVNQQGKFWDIAYPIKGTDDFLIVATTRPETMLGDTAVAVHPEDDRYKHLIGKACILPLMNREIPIIADEHADPEKGSGAVKITPAHDFNDFEVGLRHSLKQISVIDENGAMNENAGEYQGLDRFEARKKILDDLEKLGLLRGEEPHETPIPQCYRCNSIVEPFLSKQWFVKMKPLAEPALKVVREGKIRFHPKHWEETYFHWMENIQDWCISRQIWWGHRIPVWYCENEHVIVNRDTPTNCSECGSANLTQDEDVLDTWFSAWLWPFSTLGWPDETEDLKRFYPTDTLATGPDIIFFWVARMIMAGLEFMGDIPFTDVYFNGMIRDNSGRKMSKSLGNSPDPLWLIDGTDRETVGEFAKSNPSYKKGVPAYGADAVRFTMVYLTPLGGDINFDHTLVEVGQRFTNKLWNASRFVLMNMDEGQNHFTLDEINPEELELSDLWILSRLNRAIHVINKAMESFKLNDAAHALYSFVWSEFCDWYLELVKPRLYEDQNSKSRLSAQSLTLYVLEKIILLTHPFMPFFTEEIWHALAQNEWENNDSIMEQSYPSYEEAWINKKVERKMVLLQKVITAIRAVRGEMNVPPSKFADLIVQTPDVTKQEILQENESLITKLAKIGSIQYNAEKPRVAASSIVKGIELFVPLEGLIDLDLERARLKKEIDRLEKQIFSLNRKLTNRDFIDKAPKEVVEKEKKKKQDFEQSLQKLQVHLEQLET